jgi:hypothetical protein
LGVIGGISTPETVPSLASPLIIAMTLGFVGYGLFLVRSPPVRADGDPPVQEPARGEVVSEDVRQGTICF